MSEELKEKLPKVLEWTETAEQIYCIMPGMFSHGLGMVLAKLNPDSSKSLWITVKVVVCWNQNKRNSSQKISRLDCDKLLVT